MVSLLMRRPSLAGLPAPSSDVEIATPADAEALAQLLDASFDEPWDADRVRKDLWNDPTVEQTYLVRSGDRVVATASARIMSEDYPGAGYLHWVASHPDVRGRGLGLAVTLAVLHRFTDDGLEATVLETDDERLAAITLYLGLGYIPQYRDPAHEDRWSAIFQAIAQRQSEQRIQAGR